MGVLGTAVTLAGERLEWRVLFFFSTLFIVPKDRGEYGCWVLSSSLICVLLTRTDVKSKLGQGWAGC